MKPRGRIHRIVMWTAWLVLGLSVAAWVVSLFHVYLGMDGLGVALYQGALFVAVDRDAWTHISVDGFHWPTWWLVDSKHFAFMRIYYQVYWDAYLPLWIPAAASMGVVVAGGLLRRRSSRDGTLCPTCGYDLTGIDGVCPECGRGITDPSPSP